MALFAALTTFASTYAGTPEAAQAPSTVADSAPMPKSLSMVDQRIIVSLTVDCQIESAMADFGTSRLQLAEARQFNERLSQDYAAIRRELESAVGDSSKTAAESDPEHATSEVVAATAKQRSGNAVRLSLVERSLLKIKTATVEEWAEALQTDLAASNPAEFDLAYMRSQVFRQMQMLGTLKVLSTYASPQFAPVLTQKAARLQFHLEAAKALVDRLEDETKSDGRPAPVSIAESGTTSSG